MRKLNLRNAIVSIILMIAGNLFSSPRLLAQDIGTPVHGNVTDSSGKPVSGASVLNVKSGKGTSTDQDGNFTIVAAKGQVLQISFVGYQRVRVTYSGQGTIGVKLLSDNSSLGDVVVIGYGTAKRKDLTGAIASVVRRPSDFVGRYGGEEFVVVLPDTDLAGAWHIGEKIRHAVELEQIPHEGNPHRVVTVSIGCATTEPSGTAQSVQLLESADAAMYQAKEAGRNCVRLAT